MRPPRPPAANDNAATAAAADPVLDTADGLRRLMGARPLYHQLLRRFAGDYADTAARLRQSLDAGQTDAAGRLAHTLKGAAGLIGAGQVCALAAVIDTALRGGRHHRDGNGGNSSGDGGCNSGGGNAVPAAAAPPAAGAWEALDGLERALGQLFERIEQIARLERLAAQTAMAAANPTAEAAAAATAMAAIPAAQLCAQLAQLLRDGDGAAIDLLEGTAAQLAAHLGEPAWRRLDTAAQRFDFEAALAVLAAGDGAGDDGAPLSG
ncbi:Hpt domain-containing protein [Rugamonas sp. DEMB1]|uniref:Hpt domain-containing protein n=1 Tax=Rugamonas sp. DEMB1 TaxID=3039386 RepID=UPI002447ED59|nr:Hpt domain-containing protein [Rugamonas sp. DEMB1]WGG50756.1 Hpt domain-containing protein [Rugamonas sp. DEMB1]